MHNSYNQFLFHSFLSAVNVSNESSLSSPGALYYTVWYNRYNRAGESSCFEFVGYVRDFLLFLHWFPLNFIILRLDVAVFFGFRI